eukprot:363374-Chlamydomonas_euryale.AAC.4
MRAVPLTALRTALRAALAPGSIPHASTPVTITAHWCTLIAQEPTPRGAPLATPSSTPSATPSAAQNAQPPMPCRVTEREYLRRAPCTSLCQACHIPPPLAVPSLLRPASPRRAKSAASSRPSPCQVCCIQPPLAVPSQLHPAAPRRAHCALCGSSTAMPVRSL